MLLPDPNNKEAVFAFAMNFNAYEYHGSFEKVADIAKRASRANLNDCLTELFFAARASRHVGDEGYLEVYRALKPLIEKYVNEAKTT